MLINESETHMPILHWICSCDCVRHRCDRRKFANALHWLRELLQNVTSRLVDIQINRWREIELLVASLITVVLIQTDRYQCTVNSDDVTQETTVNEDKFQLNDEQIIGMSSRSTCDCHSSMNGKNNRSMRISIGQHGLSLYTGAVGALSWLSYANRSYRRRYILCWRFTRTAVAYLCRSRTVSFAFFSRRRRSIGISLSKSDGQSRRRKGSREIDMDHWVISFIFHA
jgi:hypothetical protein